MNDDVAALRGQLQQLQARHASGAIGKKEFEQERSRLERSLLDQVMAAPAASVPPVAADAAPRPSGKLVAGLALAVLVVAGAGYAVTGAPSLIAGEVPTAQAEASPHEGQPNAEQFATAVERLAEKLKEQPDNAEGWTMLARSYLQLGNIDAALPAFQRAITLNGQDARLLADYADALAVRNDRNLEGEPLKLIERALQIEPGNLKALALAGTAAFNRKDFVVAVRYWERLAQVAPPDSPWQQQVQGSIAEARKQGGLAPGAAPAPAPAMAAAPAATPAATSGTTVRGTVRLGSALAQQAAPTDTVFVFARAAEGSRMPLAILRKQVKDLPIEFALDDTMAMSPAMKLSNFPRIVIDARVSKSGQAQAAPGDLAGRTAPIANNASGVVVEINEVVRN